MTTECHSEYGSKDSSLVQLRHFSSELNNESSNTHCKCLFIWTGRLTNMYLTFLFAVLVVIFDPAHSLDVECSSYTVLKSRDRAQGQHRGSVSKCDRNDITPGWYRFMGNAGTAMPTSCPPENHCGAHAPGWMQGSHPTQADGIVTRTVCYHWTSGCCEWSNNIRVRNCGVFYVYELVTPPNCHLRYCGNGKKGKWKILTAWVI